MKQFKKESLANDYFNVLVNGRTSMEKALVKSAADLILPSVATSQSSTGTSFDYTRFIAAAEQGYRFVITGSEPLPPASYPLKTGAVVLMDSEHYSCLLEFYKSVYPSVAFRSVFELNGTGTLVNNRIKKMVSIDLLGQTFTSAMMRTARRSIIQARLPNPNGNGYSVWTGEVQYYFTHNLQTTNGVSEHVFAFVAWLQFSPHVFESYTRLGLSVHRRTRLPLSKTSVLPVHQLHSPAGFMPIDIDNSCAVITLPRKIVIE